MQISASTLNKKHPTNLIWLSLIVVRSWWVMDVRLMSDLHGCNDEKFLPSLQPLFSFLRSVAREGGGGR